MKEEYTSFQPHYYLILALHLYPIHSKIVFLFECYACPCYFFYNVHLLLLYIICLYIFLFKFINKDFLYFLFIKKVTFISINNFIKIIHYIKNSFFFSIRKQKFCNIAVVYFLFFTSL